MVKIIIIIVTVLLILAAAFVWWLPSYVLTGKRQTLEEAFAWQSERYDTGFYEKLEKGNIGVSEEDELYYW